MVSLRHKIIGARVCLRNPELRDFDEFVKNAENSVLFHQNLVSPPLERDAFSELIDRTDSETDCCLLLIETVSHSIAGVINISQIFMKGFRSAYLGYYLFDGMNGRGLMTEGINLAVDHCFGEIGLHRIEANIQPKNFASIALVKRCGFTKEGYSRRYLMIGDEWQDHERWAIIAEDRGFLS